MGPLGPSREHLLQLCPLPAAGPVLAQRSAASNHCPQRSQRRLELLSADGAQETRGRHSPPGSGGPLGRPGIVHQWGGQGAAAPALQMQGPVPGSPVPSCVCGIAAACSCAGAEARADARPRDAPGLRFGTCPRLLCQGHPRTPHCAGQTRPRRLAAGCPAHPRGPPVPCRWRARAVPTACPCPAVTAATGRRLTAPRECRCKSSRGPGRRHRPGSGRGLTPGRARDGVCPCAGTLSPPQARPSRGRCRRCLVAGPSGPGAGLGLQDVAHRRPPPWHPRPCRCWAAAPSALAVSPAPGRGGGGLQLPLPQQRGFV